jgi:hypothetical protein
MLLVRLVDAIRVSAVPSEPGWFRVSHRVTRSFLLIALISFVGACGRGGDASQAQSGALSAAATDTSYAARAVAGAAEVKRLRDIATRYRQIAAEYAKRPTRAAAGVTDWNVKLTASAQARATAADQIADQLQPAVDFLVAQASQEVAR